MTTRAVVLPERPPRQTHPDNGDRGRGDGGGKNGIGGCSSTEATYDADGNCRHRRWQRQGNGKATSRHAKAIIYGAAGGRDNQAFDKRITNNYY
jgi:hypothetical protein